MCSSAADLRYAKDVWAPDNCIATIGVDFVSKRLELGEKRVKLVIWDTAGQEKFHAVICS